MVILVMDGACTSWGFCKRSIRALLFPATFKPRSLSKSGGCIGVWYRTHATQVDEDRVWLEAGVAKKSFMSERFMRDRLVGRGLNDPLILAEVRV